MFLVVKEITGYKSSDKQIRIFDNFGKPFYFIDKTKDKPVIFNLPKGIYKTENDLQKLSTPVKYKLKKLPKRERNRDLPENFVIEWANNPNKCSVYIPTNPKGKSVLIVADYSLKSLPKYFLTFIFYHELGHFFYETESFCDDFAFNSMLKNGFNISQCYTAAKFTLSVHANDRKEINLERAKQTKILK